MPTTPSTDARRSAPARERGLVEREGEGLGAGGPGVALAVGLAQGGVGLGHLRLGRDPRRLRLGQPGDQRPLGGLGLDGLGPQAARLGVEALELVGQRGPTAGGPAQLGLAPLEPLAQRGELAAAPRRPDP